MESIMIFVKAKSSKNHLNNSNSDEELEKNLGLDDKSS